MELPLVGETGFRVSGLRCGEHIAQPGPRPRPRDEGRIDPCARLLLALQFLRQGAKMHQAGDRGHESLAASAQDEHRVALELLPRGERMPEAEDALVGRDQVDDRQRALRIGRGCQQPGDLHLGQPGTHLPDRGVHRVRAFLAQLLEPGQFQRRPENAEGGYLGREVYTAGIAAVRADLLPAQQCLRRPVGAIPRVDDQLKAGAFSRFLGRHSGGLDVIGQDVLCLGRDDEARRAESSSSVDIAGRAVRKPREIRNATEHDRIQGVGCEQRAHASQLVLRLRHWSSPIGGCARRPGAGGKNDFDRRAL